MFVLDDGTLVHSASDLTAAATCEYAVTRTLDRRLGLLSGAVPDPLLSRVAAVGDAHERRVLDDYVQRFGLWDGGSSGVRTLPRPTDYDSLAALTAMQAGTETALADGADVLYQAGFFADSFVGWVDFLERDADGAWAVVDAKLSRTERVTALLQIAAYAHHLRSTGVPVQDEAHLVLGTGARSSHRLDELIPVYLARQERLVRLLESHRDGESEPRGCGRCADCSEVLESARDPLLVVGMTGRRRDNLRSQGLPTIDALAAFEGPLSSDLDRLRSQARLQVAQENSDTVLAEVFNPSALAHLPEPSKGDVFFDFEGDPLWYDETPGSQHRWGLEYLFGVVEADGIFRPFWAHDRASERAALVEFLAYVRARREEFPDLHVYHYAPYERSALLRLAGRHGVGEDDVDQLLREGVLVDLYATARSAVRTGSRSLSLKAIEPLYLPAARSGEVTTAGESITEYAQAVSFRERGELGSWQAALDGIAEYNRLDCVSTLGLRDWLLAQAASFGVEIGQVVVDETAPDPVLQDSELVARLQEFAGAGERSADQQAVAMVAAAVNYHQREAKPFWWAHFDRLSSDPSQWGDERSTFVVTRVESSPWVPPTGRQRLLRRTLRLTGNLAAGSDIRPESDVFCLYEPHLPEITKTGAGALRGWSKAKVSDVEFGEVSVVTVEETASVEFPDLPMALGPTSGPGSKTLQAAIREFADAVDLSTLPPNPALDILRRLPPRGIVAPADSPAEAILASVRSLDRSYLAVQGPPGTGKSFTGARVISSLVSDGWKVGVVAQSHATVENLLHGVLAAGVPPTRIGKKPYGPLEPPWEVVDRPAQVQEFFAAGPGCVFGGTIWDFAAPGKIPDGGFDLIVIDEAGQFSLANTLVLASATQRLLLLGDPQQLPQVSQGTHPEPVDLSALGWLSQGHDTLPPEFGYFLDTSWRMHSEVCAVVSRLSYENRLSSSAPVRFLDGVTPGVHGVPVVHHGNATVSVEESSRVVALVRDVLGRSWNGRPLTQADVLVVAAYNAQVSAIRNDLGIAGFLDVPVGTVDKFQGREAAVVIVSLAASSPDEVPRGMEFLVNRNRLNVAISRAQWVTYLVHSPALADYLPSNPHGLAELGAFLRIIRP